MIVPKFNTAINAIVTVNGIKQNEKGQNQRNRKEIRTHAVISRYSRLGTLLGVAFTTDHFFDLKTIKGMVRIFRGLRVHAGVATR